MRWGGWRVALGGEMVVAWRMAVRLRSVLNRAVERWQRRWSLCSATVVTIRMRALAILVVWMTSCSVHAGSGGFEVDRGVALAGGVARVHYMADKAVSIPVTPRFRLRLMEVQLTFADGRVKRHTVLSAGTRMLRAPLPIELVKMLGLLCVLALVCGIMVLLRSCFRSGRAEPGVAPNGGSATAAGGSGGHTGPPSVS